jgi:hypothetical protein
MVDPLSTGRWGDTAFSDLKDDRLVVQRIVDRRKLVVVLIV